MIDLEYWVFLNPLILYLMLNKIQDACFGGKTGKDGNHGIGSPIADLISSDITEAGLMALVWLRETFSLTLKLAIFSFARPCNASFRSFRWCVKEPIRRRERLINCTAGARGCRCSCYLNSNPTVNDWLNGSTEQRITESMCRIVAFFFGTQNPCLFHFWSWDISLSSLHHRSLIR